MPRPLTFNDAWFKDGRRLGLGLPAPDALSDDGGFVEYDKTKPKAWLEGGEVLPRSHLHAKPDLPLKRVTAREANRRVAAVEAEKDGLVRHAREHLSTVRQALETYSPRGSGAPASATGGAALGTRPQNPSGSPLSPAYAAAAAAFWSTDEDADAPRHPPNCDCHACTGRASRRATAVHTLGHYGDFMSYNADRLHRALADPSSALALIGATAPAAGYSHDYPSGGAAGHAMSPAADPYYSPYPYVHGLGVGRSRTAAGAPAGHGRAAAEGDAETTDEEAEEHRLPAYVLRRYSEASGVREKTLGKVVKAIAAEQGFGGAGRNGGGATGGGSRVAAASRGGAPPSLQSVFGEDPLLAKLVVGAELGPDAAKYGGGRRTTMSERVLAAVRQRVAEQAEQATWRDVDPDDDSDASSEVDAAANPARRRRPSAGGAVATRREADARRATAARSHSAVLRRARSASVGGMSLPGGAAPTVGAYSRGLGRSVSSALVRRMTGAGSGDVRAAAVPDPRRVSVAATLHASAGGAAGTGGSFGGFAAPATARSTAAARPRRVTALSDSSEDETARRATDAGRGMAAQRQRVTEAMAHTLRSLGGAPPPESTGGARRSAAGAHASGGGSGSGWYLTEALAPRVTAAAAARPRAVVVDSDSEPEAVASPDYGPSEGWSPEPGGLSPSQRLRLSDVWAERNARSRGGAPAGPRTMSPAGVAATARLAAATAGRRGTMAASADAASHQEPATPRGSAASSSRRRLTFEDEVAAGSPRGSTASRRRSGAAVSYGRLAYGAGDDADGEATLGSIPAAARRRSAVLGAAIKAASLGGDSLTRDEVRLLAALAASGGGGGGSAFESPARAMRATWAPVAAPATPTASGGGGGYVGGAGGPMGMLAARISAPVHSGLFGGGGAAGRASGGGGGLSLGGKESWAQRAFDRVSQAGAR
ncbi:hypothetical protein HYH03_009629 [Edaphochlamys debaryana]|uniref:Uncharacterized protein n=1 Tax=Edaphochlamys debaryana TaxID=47281 RepID=A0A835XXQ2_9CHLO|nr:hypothetical protein HYH03_009629 [Edaphochlamys debaryana]|eukprot:KAG2492138.1 hypothetical protein HYH03_009629 [Edaphochlamys debaryana]